MIPWSDMEKEMLPISGLNVKITELSKINILTTAAQKILQSALGVSRTSKVDKMHTDFGDNE